MYFKMVKMVYFVLCVFYHNKENEKGSTRLDYTLAITNFLEKYSNPLLNAKSG